MKPQHGQEAIRLESTEKQALMTLAIVDELAANGAMHLVFGVRKIANRPWRAGLR